MNIWDKEFLDLTSKADYIADKELVTRKSQNSTIKTQSNQKMANDIRRHFM